MVPGDDRLGSLHRAALGNLASWLDLEDHRIICQFVNPRFSKIASAARDVYIGCTGHSTYYGLEERAPRATMLVT
jgi:hypothetical protein